MDYYPSFRDSLYHGVVVDPSWRDSLCHGDFYGDGWYDDALYHHGVKGMKWGVRRYQNEDGTWIKKAPIGSAERVRQKQAMFRSKINADGILGKGDANTFRRNTINDRRRGRIAALELKAQSREARDKALENPTTKNLASFARKTAERAALNGGLVSIPNQVRGTYHRKRDEGYSVASSAARTFGKTQFGVTGAAAGMAAEKIAGSKIRKARKAAKQNYKADLAKAKRELEDWGDKANTRYANDSKYRKSGQLGVDAEKAVARFRASKVSAKNRYKQAIRDAKRG